MIKNCSWVVVGAHSGHVLRREAKTRRHSCAMGVTVEGEFCKRMVMASAAPGAALSNPATGGRLCYLMHV